MNFDLKSTSIYQAVLAGKNPLFKFGEKIATFLFLSAVVFLIFFALDFLKIGIITKLNEKYLGAAILLLTFSVLFWQSSLFFNSRIKNPELKYRLKDALLHPEDFNLASFLSYESAKICNKALKQIKKVKNLNLSAEVLLYSLLTSNDSEIDFIISRSQIDFKKLTDGLRNGFAEIRKGDKKIKQAIAFEEVIFKAMEIAESKGKERITPGDIILSFAKNDPIFRRFLVLENLEEKDIESLVDWYERTARRTSELRKFWEYDNLARVGTIGKNWASGYTINLDKYSADLSEHIRNFSASRLEIHSKEIKSIERILEQEETNDVILVGDSDYSKKEILSILIQRASLGKSSPSVNYKRFLGFDLFLLVSKTESQEELESALEKCLDETVNAGDVILVVGDIHNFVGGTSKVGTADVSAVLSSYLPMSKFRIIATTSYQGLHRIIEKKSSILKFFEKVEVSEMSQEDTLKLLEDKVPFYEAKHKRFISYKALGEIIKLSDRYIAQEPFPEKAMKILDESVTYLSVYTKDFVLLPRHIRKVVSEKVQVPIQKLETKEKEILLNLESLIHQRIINQDDAVKEVSNALRRARAGVQAGSRPIGSFLFLGPTGVGKTETSKALTQIYFGSEKKMIRLNMSEFQNINDIRRLIGSEDSVGLLTVPVRENPFSSVLLDEIEKAHPNILNLFLQVLDEGYLTDGMGRKIDFRNTIVIATSNAGAEIIREDIEKNKQLDMVKEDLLDYILRQRIFRPEFINRFDAIVAFKPLTKKNLLDISNLMLGKIAKKLGEKGIKFVVTKELKEKIVELSYSPAFGAREMRRVVQDSVENSLAKELLSGRIERGDTIKVEPKNFSVVKLENSV